MQSFDVVIVGAGAAGLFCAGVAGQLGLKVLVLDHSEKVAEKIRISGGGRANFTNVDVTAANFLSENPRFCRSALSRYTPQHFLALMQRHGIPFHEKHKGQLFCDRSAEDIIQMLIDLGIPVHERAPEADELMREVETWIEAEMHRLDPEAYVGQH